MKRLFDFTIGLIFVPIIYMALAPIMFLIWWQDKHSPFYLAPRVAKGGGQFTMVKLRSMIVNADSSGVDSTSANDNRITGVGRIVRRYKLDELTQLWNVLVGDMSLVGPRPNVNRDVALYTKVENRLLDVRPGITDLASIVFSDEGDILKDSKDPDIDYNQLIRPWKSRLALFYVENSSVFLDIRIILLTVIAVLSRPKALVGVQKILRELGANEELVQVASRNQPLKPFPPPGANEIVTSRT